MPVAKTTKISPIKKSAKAVVSEEVAESRVSRRSTSTKATKQASPSPSPARKTLKKKGKLVKVPTLFYLFQLLSVKNQRKLRPKVKTVKNLQRKKRLLLNQFLWFPKRLLQKIPSVKS